MKYKIATEKDIDSIMNIEKNCFSVGIRERKKVFLERIKIFAQGFYLLQNNENKIIGYICSEIWKIKKIEKSYFILGHSIKDTHNINGNILYISSIGILNKYRNIGYGEKLFNKLIKDLLNKNKKIKKIVLVVGSDWARAKNIYKKNGFKKIFIIKGFFKPKNYKNFNGIVMQKLNK